MTECVLFDMDGTLINSMPLWTNIASDFVKEQVGVDNVCERAALKACGCEGKLIYKKHSEDGMTIAIAKREWSVGFDEK